MVDWDSIVFNSCAFICALFVLEFGADKFVDHTAVVSRRLGVSEVLVALLTAGAEWEELAVVTASLSRGRSSIAVGNVIGSSISNILGAFSLGLIFHRRGVTAIVYDGSAKIYSTILLLVSTAIPVAFLLKGTASKVYGGVLIGTFVVYVGSVLWGISRGRMTAPELSDDDSSDDSDSDGESDDGSIGVEAPRQAVEDEEAGLSRDEIGGQSEVIRLRSLTPKKPVRNPRPSRPKHGLMYHILHLLLGFFCIGLSGYILSHTSSSIATDLQISDVFFGVVVLALATTLPEKFVAILSGFRGQPGIMVANTVGSNIFLLTLCLGIVMVSTGDDFDSGSVSIIELAIMWVSTLALAGTVWFWGKWTRMVGVGMLALYIAFLALEISLTVRGK
ncbi:hypothetical protein V1525DRAFT_406073 [Lipomyces kononenkoae]|uniref:Uncharacterized protein n=1 Tax=Lipomyces kononenkoae TaxID=34357 RepID=A0ACC3SYN2_LIPKO